jgi:hypothetical protein
MSVGGRITGISVGSMKVFKFFTVKKDLHAAIP